MQKLLTIFGFLILTAFSYAQEYICISIFKTSEKINIDGELKEDVWSKCDKASDFWQNFPFDTSIAITKTVAMITYDEKNIYVAAICYDSLPGNYIIQSLKRDFAYPVSDAFVVTIDPFADKQNGFSFGVNPYGAQREGLVSNGGDQGAIINWDNKWFSEVKRFKDKWIVEMAIPFKSIRFKNDLKDWRINFSRNDLKRNENSTWNKVPRQFNVSSLAYTGTLHIDSLLKKTGKNISVIPYAIGGMSQDFTKKQKPQYTYNAGGDAKIAVSSALNLDLTINPDFSQVEVDRQLTNLTRFSLFFPEQRQFFVENSDLFQSFGFRQIRPFFSRRIGLDNGNIIPILGGARLSGKPNKNWRIGVLDMQTAKTVVNDKDVFAQNYFVTAVQRNVFERSNIAMIFVNRQQLDTTGLSATNFNRVVGLDYNLASADNHWTGKFFFHHSLSNKNNNNAYTHASWLRFANENWSIHWNHEYVNKNYNAETGFTPRIFQTNQQTGVTNRLTYWRIEPIITYNYFPKKGKINKVSYNLYGDYYCNDKYTTTDNLAQASTTLLFRNSSTFYVGVQNHYTKLLFPTDVSFSGQSKLLNTGQYLYTDASINFKTNQRKIFIIGGTVSYGSYFVGNKLSYNTELSYRWQPCGIFALSYTHDEILLPYLNKKVSLDLIGPKMELSFSKKLFLTTFFQYNSQVDNFNINARLQYRFKPMSDFFIVYSDNYYATNLEKKNRAVVAKFVYWFNL